MTQTNATPIPKPSNSRKLKHAIPRKMRVHLYNFERSFVENVKEIYGTGWTAEEAKERYGL